METSSPPNLVPLALGLSFGLSTLAIIVLIVIFRRRRRRKSALLDARGTVRGDQRSDATQERGQESKLRPRSTHPPTLGSTLSSGAPTATAVLTTSIGTPESGMAPSHELDKSDPAE